MTTTTDAAATARETRRRAAWVGIGLPVALTAVAAVLMASWVPDLPDPVAVHWSGNTPDGYGSAWAFILTPLGVSAAFGVFMVAVAKPTSNGLLHANQKFAIVTGTWMAVLLGVGMGGSLWVQRGLDDAADARGVGFWLLAGALGGVVLAWAAWFLLPETDREVPSGEAVHPIRHEPTELVFWSRTTPLGRPVRWVLVVTFAALFVTALVLGATGSEAFITIVATTVFLALLFAFTLVWRVTADRSGLTVRSVLGWPRIRIPADQIDQVTTVDVNAVADFGGWGYRIGAAGRSGVILRAGDAIEVHRTDGRRFVVTVDDATTGAAVLASAAARR